MAKEIGACQVTLKNINALGQKNHAKKMHFENSAPPPPPSPIIFLKAGPLTV